MTRPETVTTGRKGTDVGRASPGALYRKAAIAETITWTILIVGMVFKYGAGWPIAVLIGGSIHGLVFITYALTAGIVGINQRWTARRITAAVAVAIVPYATIPFDRHLDRKNLLDGDWRRTPTDDPRDHTVAERLLRFFLARPLLSAIAFAVMVAAIMTTLLIIGPPGGGK